MRLIKSSTSRLISSFLPHAFNLKLVLPVVVVAVVVVALAVVAAVLAVAVVAEEDLDVVAVRQEVDEVDSHHEAVLHSEVHHVAVVEVDEEDSKLNHSILPIAFALFCFIRSLSPHSLFLFCLSHPFLSSPSFCILSRINFFLPLYLLMPRPLLGA